MNIRDAIREYDSLLKLKSDLGCAIGDATTKKQHEFIRANKGSILSFIQSDEGRIAVAQFVQDWEDCTKKSKKA